MVETLYELELERFVETYNCTLSHRSINSLVLLNLYPRSVPDNKNGNIPSSRIDIILSEERVLGIKKIAREDFAPNIRARINGEQTRFYWIGNHYIAVGIRGDRDLKGFLWENGVQQPNEMSLDYRYDHQSGLFIPYGLFVEGQIPAYFDFHRKLMPTLKSGCTYEVSKHDDLFVMSREDEKSRIDVSFPNNIPINEFHALEKHLIAEVDWIDLPRKIPILHFSAATKFVT